MDSYKGKNISDTVTAAGSMIIFLIFAGCMLIIIGTAAAAYSRISDSFGSSFNSSAAVKYLSNKIRGYDECEITDGALLLRSGEVYCAVWCGSGGIYEKSAFGAPPERSGGEKIFSADSFAVTENNGLYSISVNCGGECFGALLRKE